MRRRHSRREKKALRTKRNRKHPLPKEVSQLIHARKRALSRFGVVLTHARMRGIIQEVVHGRESKVVCSRGRRYYHLHLAPDTPAVAVYDPDTDMITTFLTIEQYHQRRFEIEAERRDSLTPTDWEPENE